MASKSVKLQRPARATVCSHSSSARTRSPALSLPDLKLNLRAQFENRAKNVDKAFLTFRVPIQSSLRELRDENSVWLQSNYISLDRRLRSRRQTLRRRKSMLLQLEVHV